MKIYNTTTKKEVSLTITDIKSGCEWTADLIDAGSLPYNDDLQMTEMNQEDFEWWADVIEKMEANDERIAGIESNIDDENDLYSFRQGLADCQGDDPEVDTDRVKYYLDEFEDEKGK